MTGADVRRAWRDLPLAGLEAVTAGPPLVLAPHPDDESLGCGGLIAASVAAGTPALVAILTDGTGSHPHSRRFPPSALRDLRETEAREAAAALGLPADRIEFLRLRDTAAPSAGTDFEHAVERVAELARRRGCTTLCTTWQHDPHGDHAAAHAIGVAAAARAGVRLWVYPVWGWALAEDAWLPDAPMRGVRLDIAASLPAKRAAIAAHASQHGQVIDDDPDGFILPADLLALFDQPFEVFLE